MIDDYLLPGFRMLKGRGSFQEQAAKVAGVVAAPAKLVAEILGGNEEEKKLWRELNWYKRMGDKEGYSKTLSKLDEMTTVEAVGLGAQNTLPGSMLKVNARGVARALDPYAQRGIDIAKLYSKEADPVARALSKVSVAEAPAPRVSMEQQPLKEPGLTMEFASYHDAWNAGLKHGGQQPVYKAATDSWTISPQQPKEKYVPRLYSEEPSTKDLNDFVKSVNFSPRAPNILRNVPQFDKNMPEVQTIRNMLKKVEDEPLQPAGAYKFYKKEEFSPLVDPSFSQASRDDIALQLKQLQPKLSKYTDEGLYDTYTPRDFAGQLEEMLGSQPSMVSPQMFKGRPGTWEATNMGTKIWTPDWLHHQKYSPHKIERKTAAELANVGVTNKETALDMARSGIIPVHHWTRKPIDFARDVRKKEWMADSYSPFETVGTHAGSPRASYDRASAGRRSSLKTLPLLLDATQPYTLGGLVPGETNLKTALRLKSFLETGNTQQSIATRRVLEKEGKTSLPYINDVEDPGSLSFIIPDPRKSTRWPTTNNPSLQGYFNP